MSSTLTNPLDSQNGSKSSFEGAFMMEIEDDVLTTQEAQDEVLGLLARIKMNPLPMPNGLRIITKGDVV